MKNGKPELLAPAGGWEQLEYAVRFGADAVYLAADRFGMRAKACNFSLAEIPRVVEYAHARDVAIHVACNVVMHDDDLPELARYLTELDAAGADALIVSDLGALRLALRCAPHVDLHVSTQASVANAQAALAWHELGAKRIVCAREMSLGAIAAMRRALPTDLELETFVHGSMCMAYSGRCLISDYLTGRGANKGLCTQSCRWSYALQEAKRPGEYFEVEEHEEGSYILNSRDLCMLSHLGELASAGVDSVKIEGRNKKAFYVATVVNACRQVLDGADPSDFAGELETFSHRPYSTGFFFGPAHQAPTCPDGVQSFDWVADVVACEPAGDAAWTVEVHCRNRFADADTLEALSPGLPVRRLAVRDLRWIPASAGEGGARCTAPETGAPPETVQVANRAMERYLFTSDIELEPYDILRRGRG